jgi:putative SOS response-associated peptidase YedK
MCGRFSLTNPAAELAQRFLLNPAVLESLCRPRYNVAPSQDVLAVLADEGGARRAAMLRWGLVAPWAAEPAPGPINARAETVAERPLFRRAVRKQRCLVLADGFYEWPKDGAAPRLPVRFVLRGGAPFAFAGLWERWEGAGGPVLSCCILTTRPNALVSRFHDRMPVMLRPEHEGLWLDPRVTDPRRLAPAFEPYPEDQMTAYAVSRRVNDPRNDDPECIRPVA